MKKLKTGTLLIVLGNILYFAYMFFGGNETSDFSSGIILGLSIGCYLVCIILIVIYMSKNKKIK